MEPKISAPTRLEEIVKEWDLNNNFALYESTPTASDIANDTITITSALDNMSLTSPYTVTGAIGASISPSVTFGNLSLSNTIYSTGTNATPWFTQSPTSGRIQLNGEGADVEVNGWSLVAAVKRIEERLSLFQPNPELEKEWEDLRELGEQYRKLEQHIKDKQATWDRIKAMPAPEIE